MEKKKIGNICNRYVDSHRVLRKTKGGWILRGNAPQPIYNLFVNLYRDLDPKAQEEYTKIMDSLVINRTKEFEGKHQPKAKITFGEIFNKTSFYKVILHVEPGE